MNTSDTTHELDPQHVAWCAMHFALMREGGVWAVPRSGLLFRKEGGRLVLFAEMPWMLEMEGVITRAQLREQQDEEFRANREHFAAAGIEVVRSEALQREREERE